MFPDNNYLVLEYALSLLMLTRRPHLGFSVRGCICNLQGAALTQRTPECNPVSERTKIESLYILSCPEKKERKEGPELL